MNFSQSARHILQPRIPPSPPLAKSCNFDKVCTFWAKVSWQLRMANALQIMRGPFPQLPTFNEKLQHTNFQLLCINSGAKTPWKQVLQEKFFTNSLLNWAFFSSIVWFPNWSSFTSHGHVWAGRTLFGFKILDNTSCFNDGRPVVVFARWRWWCWHWWYWWWWWSRAGMWMSGRIKRQYFMFQRRPVVNNRFLRDRPLANDLIGFFNGLIGATCRARCLRRPRCT